MGPSRKRLGPKLYSYIWRGRAFDPLLLMAIIMTTTAVTLFIKETSGKNYENLSNDVDISYSKVTYNQESKVNFIPPDEKTLKKTREEEEKIRLKKLSFTDKLPDIFKPEATIRSDGVLEEEVIQVEEINTEDFKDLKDEFVPPPTGMSKMLGNIDRMVERSLRYFQDIAESSDGSMVKGMTNKVGSILVDSLKSSIGKDDSKKDGLGIDLDTLFDVAKNFVKGETANKPTYKEQNNNKVNTNHKENKYINRKNSENKLEKIDSTTEKVKELNVDPPSEKREAPKSRQPLSVEAEKHEDKNQGELPNDKADEEESSGLWKSLRKFVKKKRKRKKTVTNPQWIHDKLKGPERAEHKKDLERLYDIFTGQSNLYGSFSKCSKVVPYTKEGHTVKKDNFGGGQLVCEDPDFSIGLEKRCLVYSFGTGNDTAFEEMMADKGCQIWIFDPFLEEPEHHHTNFHYSNIGLASVTKNLTINGKDVKFLTLSKLRKTLKHSKKIIDYMKLNINNKELWAILMQCMDSDPMLFKYIKQIGITMNVREAIENPSLYSTYYDQLKQLTSFGYQTTGSIQIEDNTEDVYIEPLLHNKKISIKNYVAYFLI